MAHARARSHVGLAPSAQNYAASTTCVYSAQLQVVPMNDCCMINGKLSSQSNVYCFGPDSPNYGNLQACSSKYSSLGCAYYANSALSVSTMEFHRISNSW